MVPLSSTEAVYKAVVRVVCEAMWLRGVLDDLEKLKYIKKTSIKTNKSNLILPLEKPATPYCFVIACICIMESLELIWWVNPACC
jgi:hypothetical protein